VTLHEYQYQILPYLSAIVKASHSIKKEDFKHIIDFQERSSKEILGIVFYSGEHIVGFGEKLFAVPLAFLL